MQHAPQTATQSSLDKDMLLDQIKCLEIDDRRRRVQFLFASCLSATILFSIWELSADSSGIVAKDSRPLSKLFLVVVTAALCVLGMVCKDLAVLFMMLLGWTCTLGNALADTNGQHIVTAPSLLLTVLYYFGAVRVLRLPPQVVLLIMHFHVGIVLAFTLTNKLYLFDGHLESHIVFDALILVLLSVTLWVMAWRDEVSRTNEIAER
jgi:hypothetical protein